MNISAPALNFEIPNSKFQKKPVIARSPGGVMQVWEVQRRGNLPDTGLMLNTG
ncbi:MAG: hypothetical protein HUJ22_00440 [Gracilimonas sp.]|uniref:hypothetical protein n=1 Tax=Gracilimonas sp. TaxID=1974203 RepID=UPI0019ADC6E1|nr:hypothetical protein [Gracilimonas sp.]MBD3615007.1 hypothetical protein [Gracilimonas sp.]